MSFLEKQIEKLKKEKYAGEETEAFHADRKRLLSGEPYEYVLGHTTFLDAHIDLSFRPMIPRPETAFWVKRAIEELKGKEGPLRIADTFSGAGNVGLAVLTHIPNATVEFFELDPGLKEQIEKSIMLNDIDPARTKVVTASDIQGLTDLYDAILAVPPYVPYDALPHLDPEMIDFEPHLAFFAHDEGHEFHTILVKGARAYLKAGGTLYMEADMDHNAAIEELVRGTEWSSLEFWPDPYGAKPNVILRY